MPLSTDFLTDPRTFCQTWVIKMPGDQAGGVGLQNEHATFLPEFTAKQMGHKFHVGYNIAAAGVEVCWHQYAQGCLELVVRNSQYHLLLNGPPLTDWFRAYVLPWGIGKVARMELPDQTAVAGGNKVRAFFTAEMNGCAFLAAGNPISPVVAHLNVNAITFTTQPAKDAELDRMVTSALKLTRGGPNIGGLTGGVLHWKQPANAAAPAPTLGTRLARGGGVYADTGAEAANFNQNITANTAAQGRKFYNAPTTDIRLATMGVMNPGDNRWQFFYQRNFCTSFATIKKIGALGVVKNVFGDWRAPLHENYYARIPGNEYILIWPIGAGIVNVPAHGDPTQ
jgi:hypothetical protein